MDCDIFQELVSRMLDEDLSAEEAEALREHVSVCPSCRAVFAAFVGISNSLKDDLTEPPQALKTGVMRAVRRPARAERRKTPLVLKILVPAAACFAILAVGAVYMTYNGTNLSLSARDSAGSYNKDVVLAGDSDGEAAQFSLYGAEDDASDLIIEDTDEIAPFAEDEAAVSMQDAGAPAGGDAADAGRYAEPASAPENGLSSYSAVRDSASVYTDDGAFYGEIHNDNVDFFLGTVCADDGGTYQSGDGQAYTVDCDGLTYELQAQGETLWWRAAGEETYFLSPVPTSDFLSLIIRS